MNKNSVRSRLLEIVNRIWRDGYNHKLGDAREDVDEIVDEIMHVFTESLEKIEEGGQV